MRTQEILDTLAQGGTVQVNITKKCCTVKLLYFPYIVRYGNSVFDAAFKVAKHLTETSPPDGVLIEALKAFQRRKETL
ncbi:hypothetical protein LCGC14_2213410 [marine sediment metagenome]|uniref:Uncharacterized protein n=1 Tax=marine sediment metagenome TaxID=412755 RepID=A0A0F9FQN1_9ZZZZ